MLAHTTPTTKRRDSPGGPLTMASSMKRADAVPVPMVTDGSCRIIPLLQIGAQEGLFSGIVAGLIPRVVG